MRSRLVVGALAAMMVGTTPLVAQSSPRATAAAFLDAWNSRRWADAARFLDLDQFDKFRQDFVSRARRAPEQGRTPTVEDLRRRDPSMPREVAEYQVRMMEEQRRRYSDPTPFEFARVTSASSLAALSPADAAARWLESRDPQWQVRMQFEQAGCAVPADVAQIPLPRRRLVGVVAEDSVNYAIFREERPADEDNAMVGGDLTTMVLIQRGSQWLIQPRGDLIPEVGEVDTSECRGNR